MNKLSTRNRAIELFIFSIAFLISCSSANIQQAPNSVLKTNKIVAVADIEVSFSNQATLGKKVREKILSALSIQETGNTVNSPALKELISENVNKHFLSKGFLPIERNRIQPLLQELGFERTGLISQDQSKKLGDFLGAKCIFSGRLNITVEEGLLNIGALENLIPFIWISDKATIVFSGRLVQVETGAVLISGDIHLEKREFKISHIQDTINRWFEGLNTIQ